MIFNKFEEKLNNNELFINLKFEQVATILSGKVFTSRDEMYDIVKRYYSLDYEPTYKEIPKMLFQLKMILENNDNHYKDITNFILKTPNDWETIYKGKELFGNSFKIETIRSKKEKTYCHKVVNRHVTDLKIFPVHVLSFLLWLLRFPYHKSYFLYPLHSKYLLVKHTFASLNQLIVTSYQYYLALPLIIVVLISNRL